MAFIGTHVRNGGGAVTVSWEDYSGAIMIGIMGLEGCPASYYDGSFRSTLQSRRLKTLVFSLACDEKEGERRRK